MGEELRMDLQGNKSFFVVTLLLATVVANASLTATSYDAILSTPVCPTDTPATSSCPNNNILTPINAKLANLGKEFLQPPASSASLSNTQGNLVKSLPAVPTAILMVLTGFLCVSLVKDRRVWLATLAGVLSLGQAGVQAVPKMALRLSHRIHNGQQLDAELTSPYHLENSNRLRSDIEHTQYIGLLHHLAGIPDNTMSFLSSRQSSQTEDEFRAPQFAIMGLSSHLIPATDCLAAKVEQIIYFSPAFVFDNLPRGPPKLTWELFFKLLECIRETLFMF